MSSTTAIPQIPWPMATQAPSGEPIVIVAAPVPKASTEMTTLFLPIFGGFAGL